VVDAGLKERGKEKQKVKKKSICWKSNNAQKLHRLIK
jgi:hypothetical protein